MELRSFLKNKQIFTEEECEIICNTFAHEEAPKGDIVQKIHHYSKKTLFIESGLVRAYYLKDGKDITHFFFDENYFMAPINTILYNKSEPYEWEALENCQFKTIYYDQFLKLTEQIPKFYQVIIDFSMQMIKILSQKLNTLQFERAYDRYQIFLEMYPNLQNRVSLGDTASFLGVTQQTISVIRGQNN